MNWEWFWWECGTAALALFAGWLAGALYMQRVVRLNAEHMIRQDFRINSMAKARLIAGLRHCPVEWVVEELHRERVAEVEP